MLAELAPDVIITQDLCTVCAVSGDDVATLCPVDAEVISLNPSSFEEVAGSVETVAQRLGVPERGAAVAGEMLEAIEKVRRSVAGRPRRRIFVAEWVDPPFAAAASSTSISVVMSPNGLARPPSIDSSASGASCP